MKKIVIISSSPRKAGNSDVLADEFAVGAQKAGHMVEKICLRDKTVGFCKGCLACQKTHQCVIHDDAADIIQRMKGANVIVFATPVYYYEMSGQMKTMLDRTNPLFSSSYSFRDIYLLATAANSNPAAVDGAVSGLMGWISCFDKTRLKGVLRGVGVTDVGDIKTVPTVLKEAREMGSNC